uniref:Cupin type-1 domain-containing protein n=1 Tax=Oryza meridionalis TaxID=40149 RepID=A0A0E0D572_9ORYZ
MYNTLIVLVATQAMASDPSPLQDFCVADKNSPVRVNGFPCKDAKDVSVDDFFLAANLDKPMDTTKSKAGSNVTLINVMKLAGLNTLGISMARIDYAPKGQNPPHTHPRATEILTVIEGSLYVGFVTSNQANGENKLFTKTLNKGDVFVFPEGLIHFQFNPSYDKPAAAIVALSSQNPGAITIANAVFGSNPPISDDVLAKAFQVDKKALKIVYFIYTRSIDQYFYTRKSSINLSMASSNYFLLTALIALVGTQTMASDPSPLQDFCVADRHSPVRVNGFPCKDAKDVNVDDFFLAANLDKPMDTTKSKAGSNVTLINVIKLAGLNTLGISMTRIDYAPKGQNPPHTHPRATEILTVLEGTLYVGFVTSNQANGENKLFTKTLNKGDVFGR